jgi:hypothetical protein
MIEDTKDTVFCPEGTQHCLNMISLMLKRSLPLFPQCTTFVHALELLCFAIMRADHFIENKRLVQDLQTFLWEFLSNPPVPPTQEDMALLEHCRSLAWKTIITGWHVFGADTESQS